MKNLLVEVIIPTDGIFSRIEKEEREIAVIAAEKTYGGGDRKIYYRGKDENGAWYSFLKSDNKNTKLPVIKEFRVASTTIRGIRCVNWFKSDEVQI